MTPHISPGQDCTINPIVIDDSKRSAKKKPMSTFEKAMVVFSCAFIAFCWGIYPMIANQVTSILVPPTATALTIAMITSTRLDKEKP